MKSGIKQSEPRKGALSKERVVAAAIDILDGYGEAALTFRALASRLATGSGAIYWHVADKNDLLSAATEHVLTCRTAILDGTTSPADALRAIAMGVFDAIEAHPWVGTQLAREPWQSAMVAIFENSSAQFDALGVPPRPYFTAFQLLAQYLLGSAAQTAAGARHRFRASVRSAVLATIVDEWTQRDPAQYPYVHRLADQVRAHDEREAFLAGLNLIVEGANALTSAEEDPERTAALGHRPQRL